MTKRHIDDNISLIPYYPNYDVALKWYQDPQLCKQVDNIDHVYTLDRLKKMYEYLSAHGNCYYIEYFGAPVGDITLKENGEISIVICKEHQNKHIGRKCVINILELAKEKRMKQVKAEIYSFNEQSRKMFLSIGFRHFGGDWYCYDFEDNTDFTVNEMLEMQRSLQNKYKGKWEQISIETGKNKLLWMTGEIGEVIDIIKKNGSAKACEDGAIRKKLVEELADVLMYYNDVLLCYGITAEELKESYSSKYKRNMVRW